MGCGGATTGGGKEMAFEGTDRRDPREGWRNSDLGMPNADPEWQFNADFERAWDSSAVTHEVISISRERSVPFCYAKLLRQCFLYGLNRAD